MAGMKKTKDHAETDKCRTLKKENLKNRKEQKTNIYVELFNDNNTTGKYVLKCITHERQHGTVGIERLTSDQSVITINQFQLC